MPTSSDIKLTNDTAATTPGMDTQHVAIATYAIANLFFDGTENNYFNTKAAPEVVKEQAKKAGNSSSSYTNDLSNVARMWEAIRDTTELNAVYIDGIGTARGKDDDTVGLALGKGETGVRTRAEGAFQKLEEVFTKNLGDQDLPPLLHINVYGFSRGAAAARYFVHLVKTQGGQRFKGKLKDVHTHVNFVGLFDTVSSVILLELQSNVESLHLNFGKDYAHKVFHIMAQDEYRRNFAVTTVASAVKLGVGYEIAIPGAHSDVGGGYVDGATEKRLLDDWHTEQFGDGPLHKLPGPSTRAFAYAQGWYTPGEPDQAGNTDRHSRKVSNEYYKVALTLMVDMASKHGNVEFDPSLLKGSKPKDSDVLGILNTLRPLVADEKPVKQRLEELVCADQAKTMRHKCLHMSFVDKDIAYGPRRNRQGEFAREVIQG
jgi:hypothetical protein